MAGGYNKMVASNREPEERDRAPAALARTARGSLSHSVEETLQTLADSYRPWSHQKWKLLKLVLLHLPVASALPVSVR